MVKSVKSTSKIILEQQIPEARKTTAISSTVLPLVGKKPAFVKDLAPSITTMLEASAVFLTNHSFERFHGGSKISQLEDPLYDLSTVNVDKPILKEDSDELGILNPNPPFEANACRAKLIDFIADGVCDTRVNDVVSVEEYFFPIECELIDYKQDIPHDALAIAKTIKHIVAMHNTFGGYLIFGVAETIPAVMAIRLI
jgi:hypothetical protein